jgi:uncharacterized protein
VLVIPMDLADPDSGAKLFEATTKLGLEIDTLINNAGYGMAGTFAENEWEDHARFIQVMAVSPTRIAHAYLQPMLKRGDGRILNMASFSSFFPGSPYLTLYAPLKHYVLALSQSLAVETEGTGVTVTAVCPGPTETDWIDSTGTRGFVEGLPSFMLKTPAEVALAGFEGMMRGKRCVIPGAGIKLSVALSRYAPAGLLLWFLKRTFR